MKRYDKTNSSMVIQDIPQKAKSWSPLEVMPIISRLSFSISNSKSAFSQLKLQFYELLHLRELIGSLAFFIFLMNRRVGGWGGGGVVWNFYKPPVFNNTTKRSFPSMLFIQSSPFTMTIGWSLTNKHTKRWFSCRLLTTC